MNNYSISTLIRELRISNNYTLQNVATLLGVSKAAVSKWENGDDITTEHLYDLAKLYNVSFSELYMGKLNNENNYDYWRRNYDLSNFELSEEINNKNVDNLKLLFEHCKVVKSRFFDLLPKWANEELNSNEIEEFNFIKRYFKFDTNYYAYIKYGPNHIAFASENNQKEFIKDELKRISSLSKERYMWELTKIYNFIYDYKTNDICESDNLKALEYMLMSFTQIEKDLLLYINLHIKEEKEVSDGISNHKTLVERDRTEEEIENMPFFKVIINSGANALYQHKSTTDHFDENVLAKVVGLKKQVNNEIFKKYQFYNFAGQTYVSILNDWKLFKYNQYLEFVDKDRTEHLRDIVNIKDSNPKKYLDNYKKRNSL